MGYVKRLGQCQIGKRNYIGERIYHTGYCKCGEKVFLCESEFREMIEYVGWDIYQCSFRDFIRKKYKIHIPTIKIE